MERNAKNNISRKALALFLILAMLLISLATASVAWFADSLEATNEGFNGSAIVSYFAGGDGSSKNPYLIENSRHLYNLAWLQNTTDFFNEKT